MLSKGDFSAFHLLKACEVANILTSRRFGVVYGRKGVFLLVAISMQRGASRFEYRKRGRGDVEVWEMN